MLRAAPAVMEATPVYWLKLRLLVPTTSDALFDVHTKPLSPLVVPCSTKNEAPAALAPAAMSDERDHEPAAQI